MKNSRSPQDAPDMMYASPYLQLYIYIYTENDAIRAPVFTLSRKFRHTHVQQPYTHPNQLWVVASQSHDRRFLSPCRPPRGRRSCAGPRQGSFWSLHPHKPYNVHKKGISTLTVLSPRYAALYGEDPSLGPAVEQPHVEPSESLHRRGTHHVNPYLRYRT